MKKNNGFTLIEVLVSIAIIGLIITALFNINIAGFRFMAYNQDRVELQNQARIINNTLERQIRRATDADIPSDSDNEIVLSSGSVIIYVDENVTPMQLKMDDAGGTKNITDKIIDGYSFIPINDNDENRIYFEFELIRGKSSYIIKNTFYPRAKN